jgi:hypothetical protein
MPMNWHSQYAMEPPEPPAHFRDCPMHEDMDLPEDGAALCECSAIESSRHQDQADVDYQRIKDNDLNGGN